MAGASDQTYGRERTPRRTVDRVINADAGPRASKGSSDHALGRGVLHRGTSADRGGTGAPTPGGSTALIKRITHGLVGMIPNCREVFR